MLTLTGVAGDEEEKTVDTHVVDGLTVERSARMNVPDDQLASTVPGGQHPSTRGKSTRKNTTQNETTIQL